MILVELARAKVNLALHVLARRPDGYHELDSVVAFADLGDELRFEPAQDFNLKLTGPFAAGLAEAPDNLVRRAAHALLERWPERIRPARITLTKNLPLASGIGGGSADAAATLRGLIRLSAAAVDPDELTTLALQLGADVPVCLSQMSCRMRGIGERIEIFDGFAPLPAVLVNPRLPVPTADVFGALGLRPGQRHGAPLAELDDPAAWRNDLTAPAVAVAPVIAEVIGALKSLPGLRAARMSGSGATCFGLFESEETARAAAAALAAQYPHWWVVETVLR